MLKIGVEKNPWDNIGKFRQGGFWREQMSLFGTKLPNTERRGRRGVGRFRQKLLGDTRKTPLMLPNAHKDGAKGLRLR